MPAWDEKLKRILEKESSQVRAELLGGLEEVLHYNLNDIKWLAEKNVFHQQKVKARWKDRRGILTKALSNDFIDKIYAATYLANANYFYAGLDFDQERTLIELPVADNKRASYDSGFGEHKHLVTIPTHEFSSWGNLLSAMDSESRHAVHSNFWHQQGLQKRDLAWRSYLVITEVIDIGEKYLRILKTTPHFDPFLTELNLAYYKNDPAKTESSGHNGAEYICKHALDKDLVKVRQQLNWLIRMPLRKRSDYVEYGLDEALLGHDFNYEVNYSLNCIIEKWDGRETPYNSNLNVLTDYYSGRISTEIFAEDNFTQSRIYANMARDELLEYYPFIPTIPDIVDVEGRPIASFATCLDYAVLKLKYTAPERLARKAGLI